MKLLLISQDIDTENKTIKALKCEDM